MGNGAALRRQRSRPSSTLHSGRCGWHSSPPVGSDRETVTLAPSGDSALKGDAKKPVTKAAAVSVTLKTADGKTGQARFKQ